MKTKTKDRRKKQLSGTELADIIIKLLCNLPTAREAQDEADRRFASAWRDKLRIKPCGPDDRCLSSECTYCQRRQNLITMIENAHVTVRKGSAGRETETYLALMDAEDADLADEFLNVMFGIPTRTEAGTRAKNVFRQARRMGLDIGRECTDARPCGRFNCHACRRSNQLELIAAFLTVGDLTKIWRTITIVPYYGQSELSKQPLGDLRKVIKRIIDTLLEHAPRISGVFVIEPSVNTNLMSVEYCQWHVHGIFCGVTKTEYKAVKEAFNSADGACRAVKSEMVKNIVGHLAYMSKPEIFARPEFIKTNGKMGVNPYLVRTREEAKIGHALGSKRISARMVLINMGEVEEILG